MSNYEKREAVVQEVCGGILKGGANVTLAGDAAAWANFQRRVITKLTSGKRQGQDEVTSVAVKIVEGECFGIEGIAYTRPKGSSIVSDQDYLEHVWTGAKTILADAVYASCERQFGERAAQEVEKLVASAKAAEGGALLDVEESLGDVCQDEAHLEAFGSRRADDGFWEKLSLLEALYADDGNDDGDAAAWPPVTPRRQGVTNRARTVRTPVTHGMGTGGGRVGSRKALAARKLCSGLVGASGHRNGFLLYYCVREMTRRTEPEQRSRLQTTLHELIAKGFYQRMHWGDWCQCLTRILTVLPTMGWSGSEASIAENLTTDFEGDILTSQMRVLMAGRQKRFETVNELITWIDTTRQELKLKPTKPPHAPIVSSVMAVEVGGHGYAAAATDSKPPSTNCGSRERRHDSGTITCFNCGERGHLKRNCTQRVVRRCFNCGKSDHRASECKTTKATCAKCGGYGHGHSCPGKFFSKKPAVTGDQESARCSESSGYRDAVVGCRTPTPTPQGSRAIDEVNEGTLCYRASVGQHTVGKTRLRPDSCASQFYFPTGTEFFPNGFYGTTTIDIGLAVGSTRKTARIGDAVVALECEDGVLLTVVLPGALEIDGFGDALISKRRMYEVYHTQEIDTPDGMVVKLGEYGIKVDTANGTYAYRSVEGDHLFEFEKRRFVEPKANGTRVDCRACAAGVVQKDGPSDTLRTWHEKLHHSHYRQVLATLDYHGIEYPESDKEFMKATEWCDDCAVSKITKLSVGRTPNRGRAVESPGQVIYADTMDIPVNGTGSARKGAKVLFILEDGYTMVTRGYAVKSSGAFPEVYEDFLNYIKNKAGNRWQGHQRLHTDHGTEYVNKHVRAIARKWGGELTNTGPHTHERIGRIERIVRVVKEGVQAMLFSGKLTKHFYGYAAEELLRRRNLQPMTLLKGKCPLEVLTGSRLSKSMLTDVLL